MERLAERIRVHFGKQTVFVGESYNLVLKRGFVVKKEQFKILAKSCPRHSTDDKCQAGGGWCELENCPFIYWANKILGLKALMNMIPPKDGIEAYDREMEDRKPKLNPDHGERRFIVRRSGDGSVFWSTPIDGMRVIPANDKAWFIDENDGYNYEIGLLKKEGEVVEQLTKEPKKRGPCARAECSEHNILHLNQCSKGVQDCERCYRGCI
jgi:hypothetical protein